MSAVWLQLVTILCLYSAHAENRVIRKTVGENLNIRCECSKDDLYVSLKTGLNQEMEIFFKEKDSQNSTIAKTYTDRLQFHPVPPKVDILIKNVTLKDTGPYWCLCTQLTKETLSRKTEISKGSLLLVVTEASSKTEPPCIEQRMHGPLHQDVVLLAVVITAAVLLGIIMAILIWILKTKHSRTTVKPRQGATNDVYEDMRGTLRR